MSKKYYNVNVEAQVLIRAGSLETVFAENEEEAKALALKQAEASYLRDYHPLDGEIRELHITQTAKCDRVEIFFMPEWQRQIWEPDYIEPADKLEKFLRGEDE